MRRLLSRRYYCVSVKQVAAENSMSRQSSIGASTPDIVSMAKPSSRFAINVPAPINEQTKNSSYCALILNRFRWTDQNTTAHLLMQLSFTLVEVVLLDCHASKPKTNPTDYCSWLPRFRSNSIAAAVH